MRPAPAAGAGAGAGCVVCQLAYQLGVLRTEWLRRSEAALDEADSCRSRPNAPLPPASAPACPAPPDPSAATDDAPGVDCCSKLESPIRI